MPFNPARLKNITRYVDGQYIVPGGNRYDYGITGGRGRNVPSVGDYPSGAPGPKPQYLGAMVADDSAATNINPVVALVVMGFASWGLWKLSAWSSKNS